MIENIYKFWDNFGLIAFTWLIMDALLDITVDKETDWRTYTRLGIGIAGLLVDGYLVLVRDWIMITF